MIPLKPTKDILTIFIMEIYFNGDFDFTWNGGEYELIQNPILYSIDFEQTLVKNFR